MDNDFVSALSEYLVPKNHHVIATHSGHDTPHSHEQKILTPYKFWLSKRYYGITCIDKNGFVEEYKWNEVKKDQVVWNTHG